MDAKISRNLGGAGPDRRGDIPDRGQGQRRRLDQPDNLNLIPSVTPVVDEDH